MQFGRHLPAIRRNLLPPLVEYKILILVPHLTPCSLADRYQTADGTCCVAPQCRRLRLFHTGTWRRVVWYRGTTVLEETGGNHCRLWPQGEGRVSETVSTPKMWTETCPKLSSKLQGVTLRMTVFSIFTTTRTLYLIFANLQVIFPRFHRESLSTYHPITNDSTNDGHSSSKKTDTIWARRPSEWGAITLPEGYCNL